MAFTVCMIWAYGNKTGRWESVEPFSWWAPPCHSRVAAIVASPQASLGPQMRMRKNECADTYLRSLGRRVLAACNGWSTGGIIPQPERIVTTSDFRVARQPRLALASAEKSKVTGVLPYKRLKGQHYLATKQGVKGICPSVSQDASCCL